MLGHWTFLTLSLFSRQWCSQWPSAFCPLLLLIKPLGMCPNLHCITEKKSKCGFWGICIKNLRNERKDKAINKRLCLGRKLISWIGFLWDLLACAGSGDGVSGTPRSCPWSCPGRSPVVGLSPNQGTQNICLLEFQNFYGLLSVSHFPAF